MFNFLVEKGLYNLVLSTYASDLYIYKNEIRQILNCSENQISKDKLLSLNIQATQKYYSFVFDDVCQEIGKNLPMFNSSLLINLSRYNVDIDNLAPAHIYDFAFWRITGKKAKPQKCIKINHFVNNLKNKCFLELDAEC